MARTGMTDLLSDLREMTNAGTADYTVNTVSYWTDDQLQVRLDKYRTEVMYQLIDGVLEYDTGGTAYYKRYPIGMNNFESTTGGTAVFFLQDANYDYVGTASYTVDYRRGLVTFASDTGGSAYFVTGYSYDLNRSAADVWRMMAAHYALAYDFSTDNHNLRRSQLKTQALEMASFYDGLAGPSTLTIVRGDC